MSRKPAALFTLAAYVFFATSCTVWRTRPINTTADYRKADRPILMVVKASGDVVEFSKSNPGRVYRYAVVGEAVRIARGSLEIFGPFQLIKKRADGTIYEVTDRSGQVHSVLKVLVSEENRLVIQNVSYQPERVSIPLSEVKLVRVRTTNVILSVAAAALGVSALLFALAMYAYSRE
jgi:hypothetical protein